MNRDKKTIIEEGLKKFLSEVNGVPSRLAEAMQYSLFAGGKRIRPILTLSACEACGGKFDVALPTACALEIIHTYSLIHDDLPAMDNDDLRRGKPTSHKVFGEAAAILAGDALLTESFYIIAKYTMTKPEVVIQVIRDIADAAGPRGMAGGQIVDLESEGKKISAEELTALHSNKTGKLIQVALISGAKLAGCKKGELHALEEYGRAVGLAFQIADDILNVEGGTEEMGKASGSDKAKLKATFPSIIGLAESKTMAGKLTEKAINAISCFDKKADPLREIARFIIERRF